jgi:hypothetical protein
MSYIRIKVDEYLAIIDEKKMVEIHANSIESAKKIAENIAEHLMWDYDGNIAVCKIPSTIGYV